MSTPTVAQLAGLAQQFTSRAFGAFPSQESADQGNALFAANKESLDAIQQELEPFAALQEEQIAIIEANSPPVDPRAQLAALFGIDPSQLGAGPAVEPDSPEVAAAKAEAVAGAEARLEELSEQAGPASLKLQETIASLLQQALGAEIFNNIVPAGHPIRNGEVSEAYKANNAPTLAAAFAPQP
jgi:hypothetical protein